MLIAIFTYSSRGTIAPHWTWVDPDPSLSSKSPYKNKLLFKEMWLLHEDNVHYDLLVPRPLPASPSPPPFSTYVPAAPLATTTCQSANNWITNAAETLNEICIDDIESQKDADEYEIFSPMNFMHCTRGVGRPKKKRFGAPSLLKSKRKADFSQTTEKQKKAKGRPKGSRNKPKVMAAPTPALSLRERAEMAAYGEEDNTEDPDDCNICLFKFSDPLKKDKNVTRCPTCNTLVHEPCLIKSGCISDTCFLIS